MEEVDLMFKPPGGFLNWLRITDYQENNGSIFAIRKECRKFARNQFQDIREESFDL